MESGNHDVRRLVFAELHDEIGEVGFVRRDTRCHESLVHADFIGGHGFDLNDFGPLRFRSMGPDD